MAVLEINPREAHLLESALHAYEQTLLLEIANTDHRAFREMLRERETSIHTLIERLRAQLPEEVGST